jgi:hypothetical protein
MSSTPGTQIEDQLRERLARVVTSLQPLAVSTGPFADPRQLYLTIGLCLHELESAQWLSVRLLTPGNMP